MIHQTAIILLAAGNSSRLGSPKQLLEIAGMKLLEHTTQVACQSKAEDVFLVLGSDKEVMEKLVSPFPIHMVINQEWSKGMGSSIKAGVEACLKEDTYDSIIISVCDQPHLSPEIFDQLLVQNEGHEIITSAYSDGNHGPPTLFKASQFQKLLAIKDTGGAKSLIKNHQGALGLIRFEHGEIDIDTQEDYETFLNSRK